MQNFEFDKTPLDKLIFNNDVICIRCVVGDSDDKAKHEILNILKNVKNNINYYIEMYEDNNFRMGMNYIKLAALIKCLNNDELICRTLKALSKLNKKFELTPENIDMYASINNLLADINSRELGNIVNISVTSGRESIESVYNTLNWFKQFGIIEKVINLYNEETLKQGLTLLEYADRIGVKLECEACNKEKKVSKFIAGTRICKKCSNDKAKAETKYVDTLKEEFVEVKHTTKTVNNTVDKNIYKNLNSNVKHRYIRTKNKNKTDAKEEYLSKRKNQENKIKEQEDKKLSKLIEDLYSDKICISVDESIDKNEIKKELIKYVESLKTKEDVDINIYKIVTIAKSCLNSGELLRNSLHDLYLHNNNIQEDINTKLVLNVNNLLLSLDDKIVEALRYIVINNGWKCRVFNDNLTWMLGKDMLNNININDFYSKAIIGETLMNCLSSCTVKITCNICGETVGIDKIRVGHNSCRKCRYKRNTAKSKEKSSDNKKHTENNTSIKNETTKTTKIQSNEHSDIISNNIKNLKERSKKAGSISDNEVNFNKYISILAALSQYTTELSNLKSNDLSVNQLREIQNNLGGIISTLIDNLENIEKEIDKE